MKAKQRAPSGITYIGTFICHNVKTCMSQNKQQFKYEMMANERITWWGNPPTPCQDSQNHNSASRSPDVSFLPAASTKVCSTVESLRDAKEKPALWLAASVCASCFLLASVLSAVMVPPLINQRSIFLVLRRQRSETHTGSGWFYIEGHFSFIYKQPRLCACACDHDPQREGTTGQWSHKVAINHMFKSSASWSWLLLQRSIVYCSGWLVGGWRGLSRGTFYHDGKFFVGKNDPYLPRTALWVFVWCSVCNALHNQSPNGRTWMDIM